jgi:hypothetical protein
VNLVASIYKKSPDIVLSLESSRLGEPKILLGANEKIKAHGWSQKVSFEDGLNFYK